MKNCISCVHWKGGAGVWGDCVRIGDDTNHTSNYEPYPDSLAYCWDTEGYHAGFRTRKNFGCVLHRERR